jgi:uncharacterized protein
MRRGNLNVTGGSLFSFHWESIRLRNRLIVFLAVFQAVLLLVHGLLFFTWTYFWASRMADGTPYDAAGFLAHQRLLAAMAILSVSFLVTSLIGFRLTNIVLRFFYRITALWLGFVNYAFFSAVACWVSYLALRPISGATPERRNLALGFLGLAAAVTAYGVINAAATRVKRITVKLPNLPASWRGRTAVLMSDLHLGNYRGPGFARGMVKMANRLNPDVVFIAGDLYDGTPGDLVRLAEPISGLKARLGSFFVEGNHEEFSDSTKYLKAVAAAGVRVLKNEVVVVDGLQILGVAYGDATHGEHFRKILRSTGFDRARPSILLEHAPDRIEVSAQEGVSLQLSGHTHRGQFWPWTLAAARMYGKYVYGLQRIGEMQIYTSCGAGTWGPPLRVGNNPEIVAIRFE